MQVTINKARRNEKILGIYVHHGKTPVFYPPHIRIDAMKYSQGRIHALLAEPREDDLAAIVKHLLES